MVINPTVKLMPGFYKLHKITMFWKASSQWNSYSRQEGCSLSNKLCQKLGQHIFWNCNQKFKSTLQLRIEYHWLCPSLINWSLAPLRIIWLYCEMQRQLKIYLDKFQFIQINWKLSGEFFQFTGIIFNFFRLIFNLSGWLWNYSDKSTTLSGNRVYWVISLLG